MLKSRNVRKHVANNCQMVFGTSEWVLTGHFFGSLRSAGEVLERSWRGTGEVLSCRGFTGAAQKTSIKCAFYAPRSKDGEFTADNHLGEC